MFPGRVARELRVRSSCAAGARGRACGLPPRLREGRVFTRVLATARAGAGVPGDTAGEWLRWRALRWDVQTGFPSDLSVFDSPLLSPLPHLSASLLVPLWSLFNSLRSFLSPSSQPLQFFGGLLSSTLLVPFPSATFLLPASWLSTQAQAKAPLLSFPFPVSSYGPPPPSAWAPALTLTFTAHLFPSPPHRCTERSIRSRGSGLKCACWVPRSLCLHTTGSS